jgi:ATP-dependent helicase/nuclease subunit B
VKPQNASLKDALLQVDAPKYAQKKEKNYLHKIAPNAANALMKRESTSPSRVELLNTCLFKYFCAEGLRINSERVKNDAEPDALTRGSMTHFVLEKALTEHKKDGYERFMKLTQQELQTLAESCIAEFEEKEFGAWARTPRKREILLAHAAGIAEVLRQMREDMELSGFRPFELEKEFCFTLGEVLIKGKTDRLDVFETLSGSYIRVIDYKTGEKDFNYPEIEVGLSMQALIYLFAMAKIRADCKPSGAFYRKVNGGKLSKGYKAFGAEESADDLYKNRLETQKTTGIHFGGESREDFFDVKEINARLGEKSGAPRRKFIKLTNLEETEFERLAAEAAKQLMERLDALHSGDVRAVPTYGAKSPCPYCDYKNICNNAGKFEEVKISAKGVAAE